MKRIDFENGNIVSNILKAALPMLVAQIMSLLYNIVDRVYIARIPDVGTTALGAVGLCFPIIVIITAFSNLFGTGGPWQSQTDAWAASRALPLSQEEQDGIRGGNAQKLLNFPNM